MRKFKVCINAKQFRDQVDKLSKEMQVNFINFFSDILVECKELSWDEIHQRLFLMNKFTRQEYLNSTTDQNET